MISLLFVFPVACNAEVVNCQYNEFFVEETTPIDKNIQRFEWKRYHDPDSDEYVATLKIIYENANIAVIEHKYCDMYNFEYTYSIDKDSKALSKTNIVQYITEGFKQSKLKPEFKMKLDKIILQALNQHKYDAKNYFSTGLPVDQVIYNDNVEYGIEYIPGKNKSVVSTLIFHMSIGGH